MNRSCYFLVHVAAAAVATVDFVPGWRNREAEDSDCPSAWATDGERPRLLGIVGVGAGEWHNEESALGFHGVFGFIRVVLPIVCWLWCGG